MMKSFFCAALMLAACNVALARELKTLVLIKTNALAKPDAVAPTGDNVAVAQRKVAMATGGAKPVVPASACDNTKSPSNVVVNSGITFKATLSGAKNIKPNTTGKSGLGLTRSQSLIRNRLKLAASASCCSHCQ